MRKRKKTAATRLVAIFPVVLALGAGRATSMSEATTSSKATVTLPPRITVDGPRVLLGQIARIDVPDATLMKALDEVLLGLSPLPGEERSIGVGDVRQALALAGLSPWDIELKGASRVALRRTSRMLEEGELIEALTRELEARLPRAPGTLEVRSVRFFDLPRVGGGKLELRAEILDPPSLGVPLRAQVVALVDGVPEAKMEGEIEADTRAPGRSDANESTHARPARTRLVRSGQQVLLELRAPGLLISARGKARSGGRMGDEISVENVISGVVVRAVVRGEGRVEVYWSPDSGFSGATER